MNKKSCVLCGNFISIYREHYMAARGYGFYLLVLKVSLLKV